MPDETVEWGSELPEPPWLRRAYRAGLMPVLAGLGFAGVLVAELLPWLKLEVKDSVNLNPELRARIEASQHLGQLFVWQTFAYYIVIVVLFALAGSALLGGSAARRWAAAAGLGTTAGIAVLLTSVFVVLESPQGASGNLGFVEGDTVSHHVGSGFYLAVAGFLLTAAGFRDMMRAWRPTPFPSI
ncbi:MAG TPA: hypothetical protein VFE14_00275 [Micromonosporaceae bacterium]|nr:hypothetical protein [Micromonosporaceae bacterium]